MCKCVVQIALYLIGGRHDVDGGMGGLIGDLDHMEPSAMGFQSLKRLYFLIE